MFSKNRLNINKIHIYLPKTIEMEIDTDENCANDCEPGMGLGLGLGLGLGECDRKTLAQDGDITQHGDVLIFNPFNPENNFRANW